MFARQIILFIYIFRNYVEKYLDFLIADLEKVALLIFLKEKKSFQESNARTFTARAS